MSLTRAIGDSVRHERIVRGEGVSAAGSHRRSRLRTRADRGDHLPVERFRSAVMPSATQHPKTRCGERCRRCSSAFGSRRTPTPRVRPQPSGAGCAGKANCPHPARVGGLPNGAVPHVHHYRDAPDVDRYRRQRLDVRGLVCLAALPRSASRRGPPRLASLSVRVCIHSADTSCDGDKPCGDEYLADGYRVAAGHDNNPVDHCGDPRDRWNRPTVSGANGVGHRPHRRRTPGRARRRLGLRHEHKHGSCRPVANVAHEGVGASSRAKGVRRGQIRVTGLSVSGYSQQRL